MGSFAEATAMPTEAGFYWGTTSGNLVNKSVASESLTGTSGGFNVNLTGLSAGSTYYFQSYVKVSGSGEHSTSVAEFRSPVSNFVMPSPVKPAVNQTWLELPGANDKDNCVVNTYYDGSSRNYTHMYDKENYVSLWTAYHLNSTHMGSYSRPDEWTYSPLISSDDQPNLCKLSYANSSTHSRGHMIPNASRNGIKAMQLQTFYVTNSVPQLQTDFNDGVWQKLEAALQALGKSEEIYIVTGVAFNKVGESKSISYTKAKEASTDGEVKRCPIPNYFYKVVLRVKKSGNTITSASTIGFWFENKAYSDSYINYTMSVDQIEKWTGFDFFVNLPDSIEASAETNSKWTTFQNF